MKAHPEKPDISPSTKKPVTISVDGTPLNARSHGKLLRATIDSKLKFGHHITKYGSKLAKNLTQHNKFHACHKKNAEQPIFTCVAYLFSLTV